MRDWLTVIIILLILGIALDGLRRLRAHRRNALRYSRKLPNDDGSPVSEEDLTSEFPSGGARVATRRDPNEVPTIHRNLKESHAASKMTRGAPPSRASEKNLDLDTPVPMLMDSVEDGDGVDNRAHAHGKEPALGNLDDLDSDSADQNSFGTAKAPTARTRFDDWEESVDDEDDEFARRYLEEPEPEMELEAEPEPEQVRVERMPESRVSPKVEPQAASKPGAPKAVAPKGEPAPAAKAPENKEPKDMPDEVLIINVMAKGGQLFPGDQLLRAMLEQGLRFGEMDIFHRHQSEDGEGPILFSVANMVKPGTFDLDTMHEFATPGVSMFLTLPIRGDSLAAYTLMAQTAQNMAQELGGELKDENRSVMTRQTIEHGRQRVIEYERKRRLARA